MKSDLEKQRKYIYPKTYSRIRHEVVSTEDFTGMRIDEGLEPVVVVLDLNDMGQSNLTTVLREELDGGGETVVLRIELSLSRSNGSLSSDGRSGRCNAL